MSDVKVGQIWRGVKLWLTTDEKVPPFFEGSAVVTKVEKGKGFCKVTLVPLGWKGKGKMEMMAYKES